MSYDKLEVIMARVTPWLGLFFGRTNTPTELKDNEPPFPKGIKYYRLAQAQKSSAEILSYRNDGGLVLEDIPYGALARTL